MIDVGLGRDSFEKFLVVSSYFLLSTLLMWYIL